MPASTLALPSRPPHPWRRRRPTDAAVSEVLSQIIIFGILAMMLILSLVAFGSAQRAVAARAVDLGAQSAATRVAGVVVQSAVLAEQLGNGTNTNVTYRIDLPRDLEGRSYTVALQGGAHEQVWVNVTSQGIAESAGLFAAGAPSSFQVCTSQVAGGPLYVRFDANPPNSGKYCLFLVRAS